MYNVIHYHKVESARNIYSVRGISFKSKCRNLTLSFNACENASALIFDERIDQALGCGLTQLPCGVIFRYQNPAKLFAPDRFQKQSRS